MSWKNTGVRAIAITNTPQNEAEKITSNTSNDTHEIPPCNTTTRKSNRSVKKPSRLIEVMWKAELIVKVLYEAQFKAELIVKVLYYRLIHYFFVHKFIIRCCLQLSIHFMQNKTKPKYSVESCKFTLYWIFIFFILINFLWFKHIITQCLTLVLLS